MLLALEFGVLNQDNDLFEIKNVSVGHYFLAVRNRALVSVVFWVVVEVVESEIGEGMMLTIPSPGWVYDE